MLMTLLLLKFFRSVKFHQVIMSGLLYAIYHIDSVITDQVQVMCITHVYVI